MTRHLALLRSVNVGGRTIKRDQLVPAFEGMGFTGVWTFLASGNVVFDAPAPPSTDRIEAALNDAVGMTITAFLRTPAELFELVDDNPFGDGPGTRYVGFAHQPLDPGLVAALDENGRPADSFVVRGRELHWHIGGRFSDSPLAGPKLERVSGVALTVRKDTTLARLAKKLR